VEVNFSFDHFRRRFDLEFLSLRELLPEIEHHGCMDIGGCHKGVGGDEEFRPQRETGKTKAG